MNPKEYFSEIYIEDLKRFIGYEFTGNGPQGMLCGATLQSVIIPDTRYKYQNINEFILSLYCMNLINYGIQRYFLCDYETWHKISTAFADCQACGLYHGGISQPNDIITYLTKSEYIPKSKLFKFDLLLIREYLKFFLKDYLKDLKPQFIKTNSTLLISALKKDKYCAFFQQNWID